jgi:hypothetical protein
MPSPEHPSSDPPTPADLNQIWFEIGKKNPWIREATDPPFTIESFSGEADCATVQQLVRSILRGNWCLGTVFHHQDICFINQVDGGDEWLTIKGRTPFESITFRTFRETHEEAERRASETIERIRKATEEQCRRLAY